MMTQRREISYNFTNTCLTKMITAFASLFILIIVALIEVLVENLIPVGLATVKVKHT